MTTRRQSPEPIDYDARSLPPTESALPLPDIDPTEIITEERDIWGEVDISPGDVDVVEGYPW